MKTECIECLIECNREIEFTYLNKRYSITYFEESGERMISVCEFYKKPLTVKTSSEVLKLTIGGKSLEAIFSTLPDTAFDIF